jgi:hypothetical protein
MEGHGVINLFRDSDTVDLSNPETKAIVRLINEMQAAVLGKVHHIALLVEIVPTSKHTHISRYL